MSGFRALVIVALLSLFALAPLTSAQAGQLFPPTVGVGGAPASANNPCPSNTVLRWDATNGAVYCGDATPAVSLGKGVVYSNSDIHPNILTTPVAYGLCVLSMSGVASCGRCVVSQNSDGTWNLDQASCNPGIPNSSYQWCGMTCFLPAN